MSAWLCAEGCHKKPWQGAVRCPWCCGFRTDSKNFGDDPALKTTPFSGDCLLPAQFTNHASRMSKIDGCPECVVNTESPCRVEERPGETRAYYICADCGHEWYTSWNEAV